MDSYNVAKNNRVAKWQSLVGSYEKIAKTLEDRWLEVENGYQDLEAEKDALAEKNGGTNAAADSDILDINAGGQIVRVTRGTLTQIKGSRLEALFSGRWEKQLHRDSKGRIFLDVNPTCFKCIVDYLNECKIAPPENPPELPRVDAENQIFLDCLLTAFGLDATPTNHVDSTILNESSHIRALLGFLPDDDNDASKGLVLLYRGTRDGLNAKAFHRLCDNQGPTVTVVKSSEGYIFGGYSDLAWACQAGWSSSTKAFLFGLHCHKGKEPVKMTVKSGNPCALYQNRIYGPTFGAGHDLFILEGVGGAVSHSNLGSSYIRPPGYEQVPYYFTGARNFTISEVEVFKVAPAPLLAAAQDQPWPKLVFSELPDDMQKSFEAEEETLLEAYSDFSSLRDAFDKEQEAVAVFCQSGHDDVVLLNVSGQSMAVKHSTLGQYPDSVLFKQFADPNWNGESPKTKKRKRKSKGTKSKTLSTREWSKKQVVAWSKTIDGLSGDVSCYFDDITGTELLVLGREDLKDLGIQRPGTVALVVDAIQKLRDEDDENSATFIEHSDYCFGKIIDHMRLKTMSGLDVPDPSPPEIREPDKQRFKRIVQFYFPTEESAAQFLAP